MVLRYDVSRGFAKLAHVLVFSVVMSGWPRNSRTFFSFKARLNGFDFRPTFVRRMSGTEKSNESWGSVQAVSTRHSFFENKGKVVRKSGKSLIKPDSTSMRLFSALSTKSCGGAVVQWLARWTSDKEVGGSSPTSAVVLFP